MELKEAKCPNCGGVLSVDPSKDAMVCEYCNTPFIVEKAINNFNTSYTTVNDNHIVISTDSAEAIDAAARLRERERYANLSYKDKTKQFLWEMFIILVGFLAMMAVPGAIFLFSKLFGTQ